MRFLCIQMRLLCCQLVIYLGALSFIKVGVRGCILQLHSSRKSYIHLGGRISTCWNCMQLSDYIVAQPIRDSGIIMSYVGTACSSAYRGFRFHYVVCWNGMQLWDYIAGLVVFLFFSEKKKTGFFNQDFKKHEKTNEFWFLLVFTGFMLVFFWF